MISIFDHPGSTNFPLETEYCIFALISSKHVNTLYLIKTKVNRNTLTIKDIRTVCTHRSCHYQIDIAQFFWHNSKEIRYV